MTHGAPTLDDLNSLNYEIAAMVKAGVPLELGLSSIASLKESRFAELSNRIANRLSSGVTLPDAIAQEGPAISPVYTSVLKAGMAAGNLPVALESLADSGHIIQETRRQVWLSTLYPVICLLFAYVIFNFIVLSLPERSIDAAEFFGPSSAMKVVRSLQRYRNVFSTVIPLTVIGVVGFIYFFRASLTRDIWQFLTSFRWAIGSSLDWSQFSELLSMQVERGVPLGEALVLAADTTHDIRWHQQARAVSQSLKQGKSLTTALETATLLPPVVRWMLASGEKQGQLPATLKQLAELYRRQALRRAAIVKIWVPVTMTLVFTLTIGLTYALAFFIPFRALLLELMKE
jgi:general secretion pathway protein F